MYFHHVLVKVVQGSIHSFICFAPATAILGKPKELPKDGINSFNHFLLCPVNYTQQLFTLCSNDC
ncbi:hypothetical protein CsSME_00011534 [Camellia sinensis var. sinensis]